MTCTGKFGVRDFEQKHGKVQISARRNNFNYNHTCVSLDSNLKALLLTVLTTKPTLFNPSTRLLLYTKTPPSRSNLLPPLPPKPALLLPPPLNKRQHLLPIKILGLRIPLQHKFLMLQHLIARNAHQLIHI